MRSIKVFTQFMAINVEILYRLKDSYKTVESLLKSKIKIKGLIVYRYYCK